MNVSSGIYSWGCLRFPFWGQGTEVIIQHLVLPISIPPGPKSNIKTQPMALQGLTGLPEKKKIKGTNLLPATPRGIYFLSRFFFPPQLWGAQMHRAEMLRGADRLICSCVNLAKQTDRTSREEISEGAEEMMGNTEWWYTKWCDYLWKGFHPPLPTAVQTGFSFASVPRIKYESGSSKKSLFN